MKLSELFEALPTNGHDAAVDEAAKKLLGVSKIKVIIRDSFLDDVILSIIRKPPRVPALTVDSIRVNDDDDLWLYHKPIKYVTVRKDNRVKYIIVPADFDFRDAAIKYVLTTYKKEMQSSHPYTASIIYMLEKARREGYYYPEFDAVFKSVKAIS